MDLLSLFRSKRQIPAQFTTQEAADFKPSAYVSEYLSALNRTEELGFEAPMRLLVRKDCIEMEVVRPVLLDYFGRHSPEDLIGQTAAINFALVPLIYDKIGIPLNLTIGWVMRQGKPMFQHDERLIRRFIYHPTLVGPDFFHKTGGVL